MRTLSLVAVVLFAASACGGRSNGGAGAAGGGAGASGAGGRGGGAAGAGGATGGAEGSAGAGGGGSGGSAAGAGVGGIAGSAVGGSGGGAGDGGGGRDGGTAGSGGASGGRGGASGAGGIVDAGSDAPRGPVTAAPGATLVKIDPAARRQTFEGWGTSLCWWANHVGGWSATARNAVVDAIVDPQAGLGYNIFRYNIGGGENPAHEHMRQWGEMPGFLNAAGTWDWNADANQRNVLQRIVERNAGAILEAFSNSPPYWMTKSGCASGNTDGSNNLKDDSYDAFADYLTEVVKHYKDTFGITFRTLEPLNEPNANWWTADGSQEGCHFGGTNQQQIIKAVGASLTAKGLTGTTIGASDENSLDEAYNIMRTYDAATLATMSQMNGHSYNAGASARPNLRMLATSKNKKLWQSESGPLNVTLANNTEAAMFMAGRIITDLRDLQPEAWLDWQVGDPSDSWASIRLSDGQQTWTPLKRFYMHAGFSRFIRPGATMLAVTPADMVAFAAGDGATLVVVIRNGDAAGAAAKSFTFDLTAVPVVGAQVAVYRVSQTENLASLAAIPVQNWSFTVSAPAFSLTTLVIPLR